MDGIGGTQAIMSRIQLTVLRQTLDMTAAQAEQVMNIAEAADPSRGGLVDMRV